MEREKEYKQEMQSGKGAEQPFSKEPAAYSARGQEPTYPGQPGTGMPPAYQPPVQQDPWQNGYQNVPYSGYQNPNQPLAPTKKKLNLLLYILIGVVSAALLLGVVLLVMRGMDKLTDRLSGNGPEEQTSQLPDETPSFGTGTVVTDAPAAPAETASAEPAPSPTPAVTAPVNQQVVTVQSNGSTGTLTLQEWRDNQWIELYSTTVYLGSNGVTENKREGDHCTPAGTFEILFYMSLNDLGSQLTYVPVQEGDIWVCDPASASYNTLRHAGETGDWNASLTENFYNYFSLGYTGARIFFSYNGDGRTEGTAVSGAGSAIFLDGATSDSELRRGYGDIMIPMSEMEVLLSLLNSSLRPVLVVQ